jgi:hypothetical protein
MVCPTCGTDYGPSRLFARKPDGLWTSDHDTLAEAIGWLLDNGEPDGMAIARYLTEHKTVRVLDPDDTELVERVADIALMESWVVRAVIVALRQP